MTHVPENVKGRFSRFRGWLSDLKDRAMSWPADHPKTLAYIAFFLFLNYALDFGPEVFKAISSVF